MTSIVGVTALQELRKFKGFENAIIAGGFVRDSLMNVQFRDLDIFIPGKSLSHLSQTLKQHWKPKTEVEFEETVSESEIDNWITAHKKLKENVFEKYFFGFHPSEQKYIVKLREQRPPEYERIIGNFTDFEMKSKEHYDTVEGLVGVYGCKYMGFLDVDICAYTPTGEVKFDGTPDEFGKQVVSRFNFNIDKVYYDGETTVITKEADRDMKYKEATLCKLDDISQLPNAMQKFFKLKAKYPALMFRSSCLDITTKKEEPDKKLKTKNYKTYLEPGF